MEPKAVAKFRLFHLSCPAIDKAEDHPELLGEQSGEKGELYRCPRCQDAVVLQVWIAVAEPMPSGSGILQ